LQPVQVQLAHARHDYFLGLRVAADQKRRVLVGDLGERGHFVAFPQVHDAHALRVAADDADLADVGAVDHAARRDEHDVIAVAHGRHADDGAVACAGANVAHTLAAPALLAVVHRRTAHFLLAARFVDRLLDQGFLGDLFPIFMRGRGR